TGYADSANYANNAGGWSGYGFPGGSGYLYFDGMGLSWGQPSGSGDMYRSVYDTDYNDQVDYAQSAGSAGYADSAGSAGYAGNATQWNGFDMPGDPGFNSYVAFLAHNEYGQLTWIQADSWRGPQGEQGPPGEMSAYTWANGSSSSNPNVIDHASYADSAGNASYWQCVLLERNVRTIFRRLAFLFLDEWLEYRE
ncbi:MAG: hypothetical protein NTY53_03080, partial [Kiritimatiellaeota bacterium]|nr:hypothetical protein [Kiritimatiellota bacterium]